MTLQILVLLCLITRSIALPAGRLAQRAATTASTPQASGLRGPLSLIGYAQSNTLSPQNTNGIQYELAPGQTDSGNLGVYLDFENNPNPQPIRGSKGGSDPGPRNTVYDQINSDKLAPPGTDSGQNINAQWPLGNADSRLLFKLVH